MHCLHEPNAAALTKNSSAEHLEMRIETVTEDELAKLPQQIASIDHELDLDLEGGVSAEYLSLLIDACTTGDAATQEASRALLNRDFAVAANSDLHEATRALIQCLQELSGEEQEEVADGTHDRLAELCSAIAASVIIESHGEREQL